MYLLFQLSPTPPEVNISEFESNLELPLPPPPTEGNISEFESNQQLPLPSPPKFDHHINLPEEALLPPTFFQDESVNPNPNLSENQETESSSMLKKKKLTWKKIQKENQKPKLKRKSNQKRRNVPNLPDPDSTCNYEVVPGERENTHLYAMNGFLYTKNSVRLKQAFFM